MDEETIIICVRTTDASNVIKGSTEEICADCGTGVWLSPSSKEFDGAPCCAQCAHKRMAMSPDEVEFAETTDEQKKEILEALLDE